MLAKVNLYGIVGSKIADPYSFRPVLPNTSNMTKADSVDVILSQTSSRQMTSSAGGARVVLVDCCSVRYYGPVITTCILKLIVRRAGIRNNRPWLLLSSDDSR